MSWIAAAVIGGSVVGAGASIYSANQQANAAEDAGNVQQAAATQGVKRIEDSTAHAIDTVNTGTTNSNWLIGDARDQSLAIQNNAYAGSNALIREGGQEAIRRIEQARNAAVEGFKPFVDAG